MSDQKLLPEGGTESSKLKLALQFIPLISLTIAALSFIFTQVSKKKELVCTLVSIDSLIHIDKSPITPNLQVTLGNQPVSSLNKLSFIIKNAGSSAIKGEDIKEPVGLQFPHGVSVLSASLDGTNPGFSFSAIKSVDDPSFVRFNFPLLNAGDAAYISVYVYDSAPLAPKLVGRIVDVSQLITEDLSSKKVNVPLSFIQNSGLRASVDWALLTMNSLLGGACLGAVLLELVGLIRLSLWKSNWSKKAASLFEEVVSAQYAYTKDTMIPEGLEARPWILKKEDYQKAGIPKRPEPLANPGDSVWSFFAVFGGMTVIFGLTAAYIFTSVRS